MRRSRIIIGLFAAFALSFGLLTAAPGIAKAQAAETPLTASSDAALQTQATKYPLWIAGKQVTSANKDNVLKDKRKSVKYNPSTRTLTLNNAKIKGAHAWTTANGAQYRAAIDARDDRITIVLKGSNVVSATGKSTVGSYGICTVVGTSTSNTFIKGSGSLKVTAGSAGLYSNGILCNNLNIQDSAKVTVQGGSMIKTKYKAGSTAGSIGVYNYGFVALSGSAKLIATGKTRALLTAPTFGQSYTPQVKAGSSSKSIKVSKKNPASSVYTKYKYVSISKAKATSLKPAKMTITKVSPIGSGLIIKWKVPSKNCTGYELQLTSTASGKTWTYSSPKTRNGGVVDGISMESLNGGTRYTVRVRAYHVSGGKTYYGAWSDTKSGTPYSGTPAG